jgi:hypothetical protein
MSQAGSSDDLRRFQCEGDQRSLDRYLQQIGMDDTRRLGALQTLDPIFNPLRFGEFPRYHDLDRARMSDYQREIRIVANCMAGSDKANLRECGTHLLTLLQGNINSVS